MDFRELESFPSLDISRHAWIINEKEVLWGIDFSSADFPNVNRDVSGLMIIIALLS